MRGGELASQPPDVARLYSDERRHLLGRGEQAIETARVRRCGGQALGQDDLRHRERQHVLRPRLGRDPLVRTHPGQRQARSDGDELGHGPVSSTLEGVRTGEPVLVADRGQDRKSTRLNSSHGYISYAVFCLKKKKNLSFWPDPYLRQL